MKTEAENKRVRFGLIGRTLKHSFSPQIHLVYGDYEYKLIPLEPEQLETFFAKRDFDGINVTIPYKQAVIPFLSSLSPVAERLGSVNTITVAADGSLAGDNTDYKGFSYTLKKGDISVAGKKVLVLGSGGSSSTICAVCEDKGARELVVVSRSGKVNYDNIIEHSDAEIIVNTTPVGMYPDNGKSLVMLRCFPRCTAVIDLIYNPLKTNLLLQAEKMGIKHINGLSMLAAQAKYSSELFTGCMLDDSLIEKAVDSVKQKMSNIVLIGMPGCGKSSIGKEIAKRTGKAFLDTDEMVRKSCGKTPAEIIRTEGEPAFRTKEQLAAEEAGICTGTVIATGGGIILSSRNIDALRQNGVIYFLDRDISKLDTTSRPLSAGSGKLAELFNVRYLLYKKYADFIINGNGSITETADLIK